MLAYLQLDMHGHTKHLYQYFDGWGRSRLLDGSGRRFCTLHLIIPVPVARISSGRGWRIQPALAAESFIMASTTPRPGNARTRHHGGVVTLAEWHGRYGEMIEVRNTDGLATRYGHLHAMATGVHAGTRIARGQVIGYIGSTGLPTGRNHVLPEPDVRTDRPSAEDLAHRVAGVESTSIARIEGNADVVLSHDRVLSFAGLFTAPRNSPASPIAEQLGCPLVETPMGTQDLDQRHQGNQLRRSFRLR